jgi:hypothetical protein
MAGALTLVVASSRATFEKDSGGNEGVLGDAAREDAGEALTPNQ